jgi:hypothetical protein
MRRGRRVVVTGVALALSFGAAALGGKVQAAGPNDSLEPLLKAADIEALGVKGVVLAGPDAYDRVEQLGFERASDASMVVVLARLAPTKPGETLGSVLRVIASDVTPVSGVGDEAYSYLGGVAFGFRKGKATLQLMSGIDLQNGMKAFLSKEQLAALAKTICGRL